MAVFITGSTGYLGAHIASLLWQNHGERLNLLVRAASQREAEERLWKALQLHLEFDRFHEFLKTRTTIFLGDLTGKRFGLSAIDYQRLVKSTDAVLSVAASLNRKSEKACLNVNLRGGLEVLLFAQKAHADHGLRRYSHVSTVAVAGQRQSEVVEEDKAIDWERSDYDPYARTKKFVEHMLRELLPDVPKTIFRPSIVMGDSRRPETTQFDMVQAFVFLAGLRLLPLRPTDRIDVVPVNFVAESIVTLHQKEKPLHDTYHLSSGVQSQTCAEIAKALSAARKKPMPIFLPRLEPTFSGTVGWLSNRRKWRVGRLASLLQVFLPYLTWNTVFANERVVSETGQRPAKFTEYCYPLYNFAKEHNYEYPYKPWPASPQP